MALDKDRWGPATSDALDAYVAANFPPTRKTFITTNERRELWKIITGEAKTEINGNADIDLQAADIPVNPGTFAEQLPSPGGPIIGVGTSAAVLLPMRIK